MMRDAVWLRCGSNWRLQVANLAAAMHTRLLESRGALERRTASLEALSPLAILNRGYALVFDAQGQLVKDAARLESGG